MKATKRIALVAHDERKKDLLVCARCNAATLARHQLQHSLRTGNQGLQHLYPPANLGPADLPVATNHDAMSSLGGKKWQM